MIKPISFTSDYMVKLKLKKPKNKKEQKKQDNKIENYLKFLKCSEILAYGMQGVMFSEQDYLNTANKTHQEALILHVPDESDSIVESFLFYRNVKFKKVSKKQ